MGLLLDFLLPVLVTVVFFLNLPSFVFAVDESSYPPATYIQALLCVTVLTLIVRPRALVSFLLDPISKWILCYLLLSGVYLIAVSDDEVAMRVFWDRLRDCSVLWLSFVTFARSSTAFQVGLRAVFVGTILGSILNYTDFFQPGTILPSWHETYNPGRSAALHLNPNGAGMALLFGLMLSVRLISTRWRLAFIVGVGGAILVTFSRSAILALGLLVFLLLPLKGELTSRQVITLLLGLGSIFLLVSSLEVISALAAGRGMNEVNLLQRLEWFQSLGREGDFSSDQRLQVAEAAWKSFLDSPLWGHGLSERDFLVAGVGSHNIYLQHLAQHGVLGLFLFPTVVFIAARSAPPSIRLSFVSIQLFSGFFSHNMLDSYPSLFIIGFVGAMSYVRQRRVSAVNSADNQSG